MNLSLVRKYLRRYLASKRRLEYTRLTFKLRMLRRHNAASSSVASNEVTGEGMTCTCISKLLLESHEKLLYGFEFH